MLSSRRLGWERQREGAATTDLYVQQESSTTGRTGGVQEQTIPGDDNGLSPSGPLVLVLEVTAAPAVVPGVPAG